jgi:hypothetical protein
LNINMPTGDVTPESIAAHEAAMVKKADEAGVNKAPAVAPPADETPKAERPEYLPEKFWDAETGTIRTEDLAKSYAELEKGRAEPPAPADAEAKPDDEGKAPKPDADASFDDMRTAAEAEFSANGELSEGTYEALEKRGFSKAMVDQYIAGAQATAAASEEATFAAAGTSREEYGKAVEWAASNLTPAEINQFNAALATPEAASFAVKGLVSRYSAEADITPTTTVGGGAGTGAAHFRSSAEMVRAMSDVRYKTDSAYRAEVAQKIMGAERNGVNLFS